MCCDDCLYVLCVGKLVCHTLPTYFGNSQYTKPLFSGYRLAKMQMLPGLITVLKKYKVELADGTPRKVDLDPRAIVTQSLQTLNLSLVPRDGWEQRMYS